MQNSHSAAVASALSAASQSKPTEDHIMHEDQTPEAIINALLFKSYSELNNLVKVQNIGPKPPISSVKSKELLRYFQTETQEETIKHRSIELAPLIDEDHWHYQPL